MKLQQVHFQTAVIDPASPRGLHRKDFVADALYALDLVGGVVTITAPDGTATVTSVPFHALAAPPVVVPVVTAVTKRK